MRTLPALLVLVALLLAACTAPANSRTVAPASATAPTVTPTVTATASAPGASRCTSPQTTTRAVVQRYFELAGSGDAAAIRDCFAAPIRQTADFDASMSRWADPANKMTSFDISFIDQAKGCDRYSVNFRGAAGANGAAYSVGPESGTPRIFNVTQQLPRPEFATVTCQ
jgi:hypothetical protein